MYGFKMYVFDAKNRLVTCLVGPKMTLFWESHAHFNNVDEAMLIIDEICNCYSDQASLTVIEYISFQKFQLIFEVYNKMSSSGSNALFIFSLTMKFALFDMFKLKSLHTWSDFPNHQCIWFLSIFLSGNSMLSSEDYRNLFKPFLLRVIKGGGGWHFSRRCLTQKVFLVRFESQ